MASACLLLVGRLEFGLLVSCWRVLDTSLGRVFFVDLIPIPRKNFPGRMGFAPDLAARTPDSTGGTANRAGDGLGCFEMILGWLHGIIFDRETLDL
jgi:hypothetical protein